MRTLPHLIVLATLAAVAGCADPGKQPVSHWLTQLRANDDSDRAEARKWLEKKGKEAVPDLVKLLGDDDTVVAMSAGDVLARIGKDAVPGLTDTLRLGTPRARGWSAHTLGTIGKDAAAAIPALEEARKDPSLRASATEALQKIKGS